LPNGMRSLHKKTTKDADSDVLQFDGIMNDVTCLGDILSEDGYIGSYLNGSDLDIFSKGEILQSHGWDRVFGANSIPGPRSDVYENVWGLNDDTLFDYAQAELEFLAGTGKPFMMGLLTLSTHGPDGELDKGCDYPQVAKSYIPAAIYCTGQHVHAFLDKIEALGLRDETIVVVLSDHLAMKNTVWDLLKAQQAQRRNYVTILGVEGRGVVTRPATPMDLYPTILELLGYEIKDGRANMGVSLFSETPTLMDRVGDANDISRMIKYNRPLQDLLWRDPTE
ncbi:MAG: sulfatase-like hydrolase/transferase, partial [Paracoccaceae bacterium]